MNSYSIPHTVDHQQNYHQLQHGFDSIGLAENVYSPTKSRRKANKMKTAATNAMNAYDFAAVQPVNPYAQTGADMFFQQPQTYTPLVVSLPLLLAITWSTGEVFVDCGYLHLKAPLSPLCSFGPLSTEARTLPKDYPWFLHVW